jgi:putative toxin-antitoxin system antitoxin component (TIGR02293 family)
VKTGQRIATKKLDKDISDHLMQMLKVLVYAKSVFEDNEKAVHWLKTPCFALGNQTPIQLLDTTEGVQLILNTLGRMEYGVFC